MPSPSHHADDEQAPRRRARLGGDLNLPPHSSSGGRPRRHGHHTIIQLHLAHLAIAPAVFTACAGGEAGGEWGRVAAGVGSGR